MEANFYKAMQHVWETIWRIYANNMSVPIMTTGSGPNLREMKVVLRHI